MPLTPRFDLSQTDDELIITIHVPTVRVGTVEVLVDNDDDDDDDDPNELTDNKRRKTTANTFHFYASPYLLRLHFGEYRFSETDSDGGNIPAVYDPSTQQITVRLQKSIRGEEWKNLDLTARLLRPKEIPKQWLHAVIDNDDNDNDDSKEEDEDLNKLNEKEESVIQQDRLNPETTTTTTTIGCDMMAPIPSAMTTPTPQKFGYGFGNLFQNIFTDYCRGGLAEEMLQLLNPELTAAEDRTILRQEREASDFNEERYIGDLHIQDDDEYMYTMVMEYIPFWRISSSKDGLNHHMQQLILSVCELDSTSVLESDSTDDTTHISSFTDDERFQLSSIPYPLIPSSKLNFKDDSTFWSGLLDILISYVYDHLMTMGDPTVESAWTITILSSSLSWLDPPSTIEDAILQGTRRMLIYPYWRNFDFCQYVLQQTLALLKSGIHTVIKALLQTRTILDKSESYYVGNKLFIDPFLYSIQQTSHIPMGVVEGLGLILNDATTNLKSNLNLDLIRIEQAHSGVMTDDSSDDNDSSSNQTDDDDDESDDDSSEDETSTSDGSTTVPHVIEEEDGRGGRNHHSDTEKWLQPQQNEIPNPSTPKKNLLLDSIVGTVDPSSMFTINIGSTSDDQAKDVKDIKPVKEEETKKKKILIEEVL